jgi:hypothetical protein
MNRSNPLVAEVLRGLARPGPAHLAYLNYLLIQAVVLLLWWPKNTVMEVLENGKGPATLLVLVIAVGMTVAYYALRVGAEEILLPGQHCLREWALATPLKLGRILRGYVAGHVLQMLVFVALSGPLLLTAFSVSGGEWLAVTWSLVAVVFQATFYRLAAAVVYLAMGHYGTTTFFSLRASLLAGYILALVFLPAASHVALALSLLGGGRGPVSLLGAGAPMMNCAAFLFVYTLLSAGLMGVLYWQLRRQRQLATASF